MMRYLQSDTVEMALRVISGTTQINKADFEALRFPAGLNWWLPGVDQVMYVTGVGRSHITSG